MGAFPSGQRGQTVNLLSLTSVVRIHPLPPTQKASAKQMPFVLVEKVGRGQRTDVAAFGYAKMTAFSRQGNRLELAHASSVVTNPPAPTKKSVMPFGITLFLTSAMAEKPDSPSSGEGRLPFVATALRRCGHVDRKANSERGALRRAGSQIHPRNAFWHYAFFEECNKEERMAEGGNHLKRQSFPPSIPPAFLAGAFGERHPPYNG